jgi:hypothetical protein
LISVLAEHTWLQNAKKAPNVPLGDIVKSRLKQFSRMNRFKRRALRVWIFFSHESDLISFDITTPSGTKYSPQVQ